MGKILDLDKFYADIGENIKLYRCKLKYSQEDLSKFVGLTRTSMVNIEKGRQRISIHTLCEIASYLKITIEDLLPSEEPKSQEDFSNLVDNNALKNRDILIDKGKMVHFFQISASNNKL